MGTEGQDGVWSVYLVKHSRTVTAEAPPALWTGPTNVDADTSQPPSGRVRLPLTLGIFAEPLEHAARDGVSVEQKPVPESWERVQLFFFFLQSLHVVQAGLKHVILLPQLPKCWDNRCV